LNVNIFTIILINLPKLDEYDWYLSEKIGVSRAAKVFNALGSIVRLQILDMIKTSKRPLHIKALSRNLNIDYATIYRHIKTLELVGLISVYEVGRSRVIEITEPTLINELIEKAKSIK